MNINELKSLATHDTRRSVDTKDTGQLTDILMKFAENRHVAEERLDATDYMMFLSNYCYFRVCYQILCPNAALPDFSITGTL